MGKEVELRIHCDPWPAIKTLQAFRIKMGVAGASMNYVMNPRPCPIVERQVFPIMVVKN